MKPRLMLATSIGISAAFVSASLAQRPAAQPPPVSAGKTPAAPTRALKEVPAENSIVDTTLQSSAPGAVSLLQDSTQRDFNRNDIQVRYQSIEVYEVWYLICLMPNQNVSAHMSCTQKLFDSKIYDQIQITLLDIRTKDSFTGIYVPVAFDVTFGLLKQWPSGSPPAGAKRYYPFTKDGHEEQWSTTVSKGSPVTYNLPVPAEVPLLVAARAARADMSYPAAVRVVARLRPPK